MKSLLLILAATLAGGVGFAAPVDGRWSTPTDHGVVEILQCDGGACGQIVSSDRLEADPHQLDARNTDAALRGRALKGLFIFRGMAGGPSEWSGKVYNPNDGKIYSGKIVMQDADKLTLRGCVVFPLCRTETWTRVR